MIQIPRVADVRVKHFRSGWKFCPGPKPKFIVDLKKKMKPKSITQNGNLILTFEEQ